MKKTFLWVVLLLRLMWRPRKSLWKFPFRHWKWWAMMVAQVMLGHGYEPEMGLGWNGNGVASLVKFTGNRKKVQTGIWAYTHRREEDWNRKEGKKHGPTTRTVSERGSLVSHRRELCQRELDVWGMDRHDTRRNPSKATKLGMAMSSGVWIGELENRQTTWNFRGKCNVIC